MAGELYLSGLTGTNFDGGAIVDQLIRLKSLPIQKLQQEKALVQAKLTSIGNLSKGLGDFLSLFENLKLDDLFKGKGASVSDSSVLSVSVTEDAPTVDFSVSVNKLAQGEIRVSDGGLTDLSSTFSSSGTLIITYDTGSGTEHFNVDYSSTDTLRDLVNRINASQSRVNASVYFDGSRYRLMLSEKDVGASTAETDVIQVSGLPSELGSGLSTVQSAQNAEIVIGSGSPITSPSNTFKDVIGGITIEVKKVGNSNVSVRESYSKVSNFLNNFAKNYNATVDLVDSLTVGEKALFRGDYAISRVKTGMADRLDPLVRLGLINYDDNGKISINTDRLSNLLTTDPKSVRKAIEDTVSSYRGYLEAQKGFFGGSERTYNEQIERIDERIASLTNRLAQEEQILRKRYAQLESFISRANEIRDRLSQFIVTLSEMNKGGK